MNEKKYFLFILNLFFIINKINSEEKRNFYKCGVNEFERIPKSAKIAKKIDTNSSLFTSRRRLDNIDSEGFKKFNIYLDLFNIKDDIKKYNLTNYQELFINSLNKAVETLKSLLRVKPPLYAYQFTDEDLQDININNWDKEKFGTEAKNKNIDTFNLGIDLIIFGEFSNLTEGVLASAGVEYLESETNQPLVGVVTINKDINYSETNTKENLQSILLHEFTHILGFSRSYFSFFNFVFQRKDKYGINRIYFNATNVLNVAKKYFNCSDIDGIELENIGGKGTTGSHWEARILLGDIMNGVIYTEEQDISEFTLALLEDLGYYKANYYTGGLMRYGKNKGCSFLIDKCVNDYEINPYFENEFYDSINSRNSIDPSCSSGRQSRTYHAWWLYENIPEEYQYFQNKKRGGWPSADYCPISLKYFSEEKITHYVGHCSTKGSGEYGSKIEYGYSYANYRYFKSEELYSITGETYSDHSFCFLSSLIKNNTQDIDYYSRTVRAICYEISCSQRSLTIKINDDYIVCPRSGGKIDAQGYKGFFLCPDYNLMCSGTILCNDMFDCVEKKSEIKEESYYYDYEIKTSQNIEEAKMQDSDNINNYELSENGICPIFCTHCKENKKCIKCKDGYNLVGSNNEEKIICMSELN